MSGLFFALFFIATSPVLLTIVCVLIVVAVSVAAFKSAKKKRQAKEILDNLIAEAKQNNEARHSLIVQRYSPEIADRLLKHEIWQGMTAEQLMDSAGLAEAVETIVTKTKRKEVWKYYQETATRYGMRVTLEDGLVVGWTQK